MRELISAVLGFGSAGCSGGTGQPAPAPSASPMALASSPPPAVAAPSADLTRYIGKYPSDKVGGQTFYRAARPAIVGAMGQQLERTVADYQVETPIALQDGRLIAMACVAHNCDAQSIAVLVAPDGGSAQVCVHDTNGAGAETNSWYAAGERLARTDNCPWNVD